jgi:putative ABC transport system permease protein
VLRQTEDTVVVRGHEPSDVLGIDPDTFARAAFWDDSFAGRSLDALVEELERAPTGDGDVPAIVVGEGFSERFPLTLDDSRGRSVSIPVRVAGRADAFPGYGFNTDRPLVVVHRDVLTERDIPALAEVWVDDADIDAASSLRDAGLPVQTAIRSSDPVEGSLAPHFWSLDYIAFSGIVAAAVPLAALGLYFSVRSDRRRLGAALARKMGMTRRTGLFANVIEIGIMLGAGVVFGAIGAWAAIALVFDHLDPLPRVAPDALFRFDLIGVEWCAVGAMFVSLLATVFVERQAARAALPELLRRAP